MSIVAPTILLVLGALIGSLPLIYALHTVQYQVRADADRVKELLQIIEAQKAPDTYAAVVGYRDADEPEGEWVSSEDGMLTYWRTPDGRLYYDPSEVPR